MMGTGIARQYCQPEITICEECWHRNVCGNKDYLTENQCCDFEGWIPTEWEEPNEVGTRALICPVDGEAVLGEYLGEGLWRWFDRVIPGEDLTHWMPLPEPPK